MEKIDIVSNMEDLLVQGTKSERKIMEYFLANFPVSAMGNLPTISKDINVSPATILRAVIKLGFKNFPEFNEAIFKILQQHQSSSTLARMQYSGAEQDKQNQDSYYNKNIINITRTFKHANFKNINNATDILSETDKKLYCIGGRITGNLTTLFARYLKTIRPNVYECLNYEDYLTDLAMGCDKNSVLLVADIRRYDVTLLNFIKRLQQEKGIRIILLTDVWESPVSEFADITISIYTGTDACWDSNLALLSVLEELMGRITNNLGEKAVEYMSERERYMKTTI